MKKSIGLLSLVVFIFVTWFAGSAYAELQINWFQVQKRTYEDGTQFTRVQFGVNDPSLVTNIRLFKNGDQLGVDKNDFTTIIHKNYLVKYDCGNSKWDWSKLQLDWEASYFSFGNFPLNFIEEEEDALFEIEIDWTSGEQSGMKSLEWPFTKEVELPIVSMHGWGQMNKSQKKPYFNFLDDGSMVLRWNAPAVTYEGTDIDTSVAVYLTIKEEKEEAGLLKIVYINQPTNMGMVIIPPDAITELTTDPDYQGFFEFLIQHHTKDQCNRTYSNWIRYYFK